MKRVRIVVSGRVQGVNYRNFARQEAEKHGLAGYVRNLADGTVEIVAEGDEPVLTKFVAACKKGSFLAFVSGAKVVYEEPTKEFDFFEVRP